jgi:precorrin-6A/cobalt-precorrin-6A reductase
MILGTTVEARRIAELLGSRGEIEVVACSAGAASAFGGAEDLAARIGELRPSAVIDATHAYGQTISRYARRACAAVGVPRLRLERPGWTAKPGDDWRLADDLATALSMATGIGRRVFLAVGRLDTALLAPFPDHWFLVRTTEPTRDAPDNVRAIRSKGPFNRESELDLLDGHRIDTLVTKVAGGSSAYAKIEAARELALPIVLLRRPEPPPGPIASSIAEALSWLDMVIDGQRS